MRSGGGFMTVLAVLAVINLVVIIAGRCERDKKRDTTDGGATTHVKSPDAGIAPAIQGLP